MIKYLNIMFQIVPTKVTDGQAEMMGEPYQGQPCFLNTGYVSVLGINIEICFML